MRKIKLILEYEGTAYLGWQRQPQGMTVQQALEEAIERVTGEAARVIGASRTDSGAHARGQTAHFPTNWPHTAGSLQKALNAVLPADIVVLAAEDAPDDFHARFSARSKLYEYTIWNDPVRPAIERRLCWHVRRPLDLERMRTAARFLTGTHDFAAFESSGASSRSTVRTVTRAEWRRDGKKLVFEIEGNGFLYNMVRAMVGTLVEIGRGRMPPEAMPEILLSRDRRRAGPGAPARGLCLVRVDY